ncbi:hypothetical protein ACJX0J_010027, partial [Zea mays]
MKHDVVHFIIIKIILFIIKFISDEFTTATTSSTMTLEWLMTFVAGGIIAKLPLQQISIEDLLDGLDTTQFKKKKKMMNIDEVVYGNLLYIFFVSNIHVYIDISMFLSTAHMLLFLFTLEKI